MRFIVLMSHWLCGGALVPTNGCLASQLTARELMITSFIRVPRSAADQFRLDRAGPDDADRRRPVPAGCCSVHRRDASQDLLKAANVRVR
jgi:hypothetical protein